MFFISHQRINLQTKNEIVKSVRVLEMIICTFSFFICDLFNTINFLSGSFMNLFNLSNKTVNKVFFEKCSFQFDQSYWKDMIWKNTNDFHVWRLDISVVKMFENMLKVFSDVIISHWNSI